MYVSSNIIQVIIVIDSFSTRADHFKFPTVYLTF